MRTVDEPRDAPPDCSEGAGGSLRRTRCLFVVSLGLQIAESRSYLYTLGPKVDISYILGAPGFVICGGVVFVSVCVYVFFVVSAFSWSKERCCAWR